MRRLTLLSVTLVIIALATFAWYEIKTSAWQAKLATDYITKLDYSVEPRASELTLVAQSGPHDIRRGYTRIPEFINRLAAAGMRVTQQARPSPELVALSEWGITPPFPEPPVAALTVRGADGRVLFDGKRDAQYFAAYDEVPPLLARTLAYIENRELLEDDPQHNPAIEWDRQAKAAMSYAVAKIGFPVSVEGGSTLATQLEKFRHSPKGRTGSGTDKLRQIVSATLKAYRHGTDTSESRREILVDYLNSIPLAAAPMWGEVYGIGDGLRAWFDLSLDEVSRTLANPSEGAEQARAYKHVIALLASLRAPHRYLVTDRGALEERIGMYLDLLVRDRVISAGFADKARHTPLEFLPHAPVPPRPNYVDRKAVTAVRTLLLDLLGLDTLYDLDRLHLEVDSTIEAELQDEGIEILGSLGSEDFVKANGLTGERLLGNAEPSNVIYSLLLFEQARQGNLVRMQADNLDQPFDINHGVKVELGSTAKLRTLAHYLELVAMLFHDFAALPTAELHARVETAKDPITRWVAETLEANRLIDLKALLEAALERRYSASPGSFFTGGGLHNFVNFDPKDNGKRMTLLQAFRQSTNLVFIRLMQDLVRFHTARLPYNVEEVLHDYDSPLRSSLLADVADQEAKQTLRRAYRKYRNQEPDEIVRRLLGSQASSLRQLTVLFYAWNEGDGEADLAKWLTQRSGSEVDARTVHALVRSYGNPDLGIADYGYLASRNSLELWCAGRLAHSPNLSWDEMVEGSAGVRRETSEWLFKPSNRVAQNWRLRGRIERDAFKRMTPYWKRLGFPFSHLVPSYATAVGTSGDRPAALADLMGIIVNDGLRKPNLVLRRLRFAAGTPYETVFEPSAVKSERVMETPVARVLRAALQQVVEGGTARRIAGAFEYPDGSPAVVGGKTGTGDNRFSTFARGGGVISSRVVNRTASFAFYIDARYFGVVTAFVAGEEAKKYHYTSALPVSVLKLFAPTINARLAVPPELVPDDGPMVPSTEMQAAASGPTQQTAQF
jgi:membrane peptidoglycan carboxypeptidase